jgi:hypothetical protein
LHDANAFHARPTPAALHVPTSPASRRAGPGAGSRRLILPLVLSLSAAAGCSRSSKAAANARDSAARDSAAAADAPSDAARAPIAATGYAPGETSAVGSVRGSVELAGDAPPDSVARPTSDQEVCGDSLFVATVEHDGAHLGGVVVWLDGVRRGKRIPLERRFDLAIAGCQMTPRVQAVLAGGALNVHNADALVHRARFLRQGTRDPVETVSYSDEGQVVPIVAPLSRAGLLEVRCDLHPWDRAWVAVFDHPYFRTTDRDGAFTLDSVPPGTYTLVAWHPRLGVVRQKVTVEAGKESAVTVTMKTK